MANLLQTIFSSGSHGLSKHGDSLNAFVAKNGNQVIKVVTNGGILKHSAVRYPSTGTIVETIVHRK